MNQVKNPDFRQTEMKNAVMDLKQPSNPVLGQFYFDITAKVMKVYDGAAWQSFVSQAAASLASHPVGSYYYSDSATDPGTLFGGTWTRIKDVFLLAAGDTYALGATGGEATHNLSIAEMPSHNHGLVDKRYAYYDAAGTEGLTGTNKTIGMGLIAANSTAQGGGAAHNNMPPYKAVYVWKRTA